MNLPARRFPRWTRRILREHGFDKSNTLAVVVTCRDDICSPFFQDLMRSWGGGFDGRALAGMPWLGRTSWTAALRNAPQSEGRSRLVIVHLAHIGMDPTPGLTRRGVGGVPTCGSLSALLTDPGEGKNIQLNDPEQSLLRLRLRQVVDKGTPRPSTLTELTAVVREMALSDLQAQLTEVLDPARCDYAVFSGVLEHHKAEDRIALSHAEARVGGKAQSLI